MNDDGNRVNTYALEARGTRPQDGEMEAASLIDAIARMSNLNGISPLRATSMRLANTS